jgi:hypothetical protein
MKKPGWTITADERTAFVYHTESVVANQVGWECYQYGPWKSPETILFPTLTVSIKYKNDAAGSIDMLEIYHIREAIFNSELPAGAFVVGAPEGTNVVDLQHDRTKPSSQVMRQPVGDVLSVVDTGGTQPVKPTKWRWGWWALGLVLALILLVLGYRRWHMTRASR